MKTCKQVTSLLLYIYIILSWCCNATGLALQLTGLFPAPVQLTKLPDSYAEFSDAFGFLLGSRGEQAYGGVCWMPELAQGKLTWKLESVAELRRGNRIFFPFWHQQQSDLINPRCVSSH